MRVVALLGLMAAACALASPCLAYPTGAEALEARLLARMGPDAKSWIAKEGAHEATSRFPSGDTARSAAFGYGATGADVDALAFLVLMQAERNADAAVRGVAVADMSATESGRDSRQAQMRSGQIEYSQQAQKSGSNQLVESATAKPSVSLLPPQPGVSPQPLNLRTGVPSADAPPPPGIDLQDAMDRESQLDDLVTDAMKALPPAQEAAVPAMP